MTYKTKIVPIAAVALLLAIFVPAAKALDDSDWPTVLSVQEPLQVSNLMLSPGTYILQRYSGVSRTVVMIYNLDQNRWEGMVIGNTVNRVNAPDQSYFRIDRSAQGTHDELRYWFRRGWVSGIEFPETSLSSGSFALRSTSAPVKTAYIRK